MSAKVRAILDAVTARVLTYRPPEAEAKRRERQREREKDQDDRESSI